LVRAYWGSEPWTKNEMGGRVGGCQIIRKKIDTQTEVLCLLHAKSEIGAWGGHPKELGWTTFRICVKDNLEERNEKRRLGRVSRHGPY